MGWSGVGWSKVEWYGIVVGTYNMNEIYFDESLEERCGFGWSWRVVTGQGAD